MEDLWCCGIFLLLYTLQSMLDCMSLWIFYLWIDMSWLCKKKKKKKSTYLLLWLDNDVVWINLWTQKQRPAPKTQKFVQRGTTKDLSIAMLQCCKKTSYTPYFIGCCYFQFFFFYSTKFIQINIYIIYNTFL